MLGHLQYPRKATRLAPCPDGAAEQTQKPRSLGGKQAGLLSLSPENTVCPCGAVMGLLRVSPGGGGEWVTVAQGSPLPVCLFHGLLLQAVFQCGLMYQEGGVLP